MALLISGLLLWVVYGLSRHDWSPVVPNIVATAVALLAIAVAARLTWRNARSAEANGSGGAR